MTGAADKKILVQYKQEVDASLEAILNWWMEHIADTSRTVFYGEVSSSNVVNVTAPIGLVLQSRILWTFSAAYAHTKKQAYLDFAKAAYIYLLKHFSDPVYGGMYWSVNPNGSTLSTKKQTYGIAFAIYGLSAYYKVSKNPQALDKALALYEAIERTSLDVQFGGYQECLQQDWSLIEDMRLSEKDLFANKSMNTHLHVIEAFSLLYSVSPSSRLKKSVQDLLDCFEKNIIDPVTFQQKLFFENNWTVSSSAVSYGHDIEAAWLLHRAAVLINDQDRIIKFASNAVAMASVVAGATSTNGAIYNEFDNLTQQLHLGKDWWPQAEAMVGFLNAYEVSSNATYLQKSLASWHLIQKEFIDTINGEWFWGYSQAGILMEREKAGFWKCPYHNGRACMEVSRRIDLNF